MLVVIFSEFEIRCVICEVLEIRSHELSNLLYFMVSRSEGSQLRDNILGTQMSHIKNYHICRKQIDLLQCGKRHQPLKIVITPLCVAL